MKKNMFLFTALCLTAAFTGCGSGSEAVPEETAEVSEGAEAVETEDDNTLKAATEASQLEALLSKYDNIYYSTTFYDENGEENYSEYEYADKDMYVSETTDSEFFVTTADNVIGINEDGNLYECLLMDGANTVYWTGTKENFMFTYNDEEEVLSQSEENGSIIINTRENTDEGIDEYTYTVDAETKEITHVYKITKDAEGNVLWSSDQEIGFNTDVYELPEEITAAMTSTDTRTVTLTTDPGTEDEKVYSKEVAKNIYANIELAEGYDSLYDDEACTVEHESVGLNEYINVYAAKGK